MENLDRHLLYLNPRTAHRHLFILNKGHTADKCRWWLQHRNRITEDLLTRSMRFAYSPPYRIKPGEEHSQPQLGVAVGSSHGPTPFDDDALAEQLRVDPADAWDPTVGYPHTVSIPYTSDIHAYRGTRPWAVTTAKRERLAMYVGQQVRTRRPYQCFTSRAKPSARVPASLHTARQIRPRDARQGLRGMPRRGQRDVRRLRSARHGAQVRLRDDS